MDVAVEVARQMVVGWSAFVVCCWVAFRVETWRRRTFGLPPLFSDLRDALNELARTQDEPAGGAHPRSGRTSDGVSSVASPRN